MRARFSYNIFFNMSSILNRHLGVQNEQDSQVSLSRKPSPVLPLFTFKRDKEEAAEHNPDSVGENGISVCNAAGCDFSIQGRNKGILINHLKQHKMEYAKLMSKIKERYEVDRLLSNVNTVKSTAKVEPTVEEEHIVTSPVSQVNEPSPNLTENSNIEVFVQQEALEGLIPAQCQWKLPLNTPIPQPVFLPSGTTLVVLDPSTLKIVHANSSQNSPAKIIKTSSPIPPLTTKNKSTDTSSSCTTLTLPKKSQSSANPNSPVGGISSVMSELTSNNLNQTRSLSGYINLAQPNSRSTRIVPIEHIRLQPIPAALAISPSISPSSPLTTNIVITSYIEHTSTDSIPKQNLISQSRSTISPTETLRSSFTGNNHVLPSVNQLEATQKSKVDVENPENSSLLTEKSIPKDNNQAYILSEDLLLTTTSEMTGRLKPNSPEDCSSRNPINNFGRNLPVASVISIASFAKINESKGIFDSKISKMCVPLEGVQTDIPLNVPAKANEPIATTASYSEDCLFNTTIPDTGPSSVTELNAPHNESGSIGSNDKSSSETEKNSCDRSHPVFKFFKFNCVNGRSECIVDGCGVTRNGKNPANLINHLRLKHPKKEYAEFMAKWTTMWARPKRNPGIVNITNVLQPSKTPRSPRANKLEKNLPTQNKKGVESAPSTQTKKAFPVIVASSVSAGSMVLRDSSDVGPISDKKYSVGSNIRQAILKNSGNSAIIGFRKDFNEKIHPVYRYFTFHEATECPADEAIREECGKSECNFQGCNVTIKGNKPTSLMIHLKLKHGNTKEYAECLSLSEEFEAQRHKSMDKPSDSNKPGKRPFAQTEDEKDCKDYFELRKKQRKNLGVRNILSPFLSVKGMIAIQQSSPNIANKTTAVSLSAIPNKELDFIGPDNPSEYYSLRETTVHEQPLLNSIFPQRQSEQFTGVSATEKESSTIV